MIWFLTRLLMYRWLPSHNFCLFMYHSQEASSHSHQSDIAYALDTSYLESAVLELNVIMNIQKFHPTSSKFVPSKGLFITSHIPSFTDLRLTTFQFQVVYHLQHSDLFLGRLTKVQKGRALSQLSLIVLMDLQRYFLFECICYGCDS